MGAKGVRRCIAARVVSIRRESYEGFRQGSPAYSTTERALITYHLLLITRCNRRVSDTDHDDRPDSTM